MKVTKSFTRFVDKNLPIPHILFYILILLTGLFYIRTSEIFAIYTIVLTIYHVLGWTLIYNTVEGEEDLEWDRIQSKWNHDENYKAIFFLIATIIFGIPLFINLILILFT